MIKLIALVCCFVIVSSKMSGEILSSVKLSDTFLIDDFRNCEIAHSVSPIMWNGTCQARGYDVDNYKCVFDLPLTVVYVHDTNLFQMIIGHTNVWPQKSTVWSDYVDLKNTEFALNVTIIRPFDMMAITMRNGTLTVHA